MKIERTAIVTHPAAHMYKLVHDVAAYPEFLKWCTFAEIHEQSETHQLASLGLKVAGVERRFKTLNELHAPGQVNPGQIKLTLVEGPFRSLSGVWKFKALGEAGCKVSLCLEFDFMPGLISSAFQSGFKKIAGQLVAEFCVRAQSLANSEASLGA